MSTNELITNTKKPHLYEKGNAFMWNDPHISEQLLQVHLNKDVDLASRKESSIDSTINWILDQLPERELRILDLGCGPGLYCEKLHDQKHSVTGVDVSNNSIEFAKERCKNESKDIEYINANYLDVKLPDNQFDLVIMIYTDFGVLLPDERRALLRKINRSLKPGGIFIFDVINDSDIESKVTPPSWEVSANGFWSDSPYILLSNCFLYEKEKVILYQHNVLLEDNEIKTYRFWTHHFSEDDIMQELEETSFSLMNEPSHILPETDQWSGKHISFFTARKSLD